MKKQDYIEELEKVKELSFEEQQAYYEKRLKEVEEKTKERIYIYFYYARMLYQKGDFRKTIEVLEPVLLDYQSYPYTEKIVSCFNLMGVAIHWEAEYSISRHYYSIALKIAKEHNEEFYYTFAYNNIALSYLVQENYKDAVENIQSAEKYLQKSDDDMGAYVYINKTTIFLKMNRLQEALDAYELAVNQYHAYDFIPDDALLCAAILFYQLGERQKYEEYKKKILQKMDKMYAAQFIEACKELFECGLDSKDNELLGKILESMDRYMQEHPREIKVGIAVANLKYAYACKREDKDAILAALELKNYYKDQIIQYSEIKRVQSLREFMDINTQLQKAIGSKEQALLAKSQFLANMSHDIRTPINGIMGMLNIIRKSENNPERIADSLDKIEMSSKLLLSLINDVLDMAKLETDAVILNNESINLDEICAETTDAVSFQAEEAGLRITEEHDDFGGIYVWSSALHLKKILINFYSNSIKYNKPGGSIHTSMRTIDRTEERITCEFKIRDSGVGMSEEFIANKLFTPFVQAENSSRSSYVGTGLGMSIVKQLVEKMGGSISVESKLGEGSCFTVVLPFEIDQKKNTEKGEENLTVDIKGMNFLVAEDNELNMEIIDFLLKEKGAKVVQAQNGLEAVQIFKISEEGTYNVILMDLMMPVMDGYTATREIRALNRSDAKTIPIIAMTANAFAEDARKCMEAGMNAHLAKPVNMDKVIETIAKFCSPLL